MMMVVMMTMVLTMMVMDDDDDYGDDHDGKLWTMVMMKWIVTDELHGFEMALTVCYYYFMLLS
jgi:hypothetical protein